MSRTVNPLRVLYLPDGDVLRFEEIIDKRNSAPRVLRLDDKPSQKPKTTGKPSDD